MAFWRLYYHLVWATKNREPLIQLNIEPHLYRYMVHKASELDVFVYRVNGWQDHVHLIAAIPPKVSISDVVKNLKGASSHFINNANFLDEHFNWQRGYGILSLGEKQRSIAEEYVMNQKLHHEQNSTNSWLERVDEVDEGPKVPKQDGRALYEPTEIYMVGDESPF
jgi:putative transposase